MRRQNENTDNNYYSYIPPTNSTSSRNPSSNSTNRNAHYQYYDPRLRARQQAQQSLYEYQYSSTSPNRKSPASIYGSPRRQPSYQPPSFLQELPSSSADSISDLGEPISIFDDIQPLEYRRAIVAPALQSTYMPPDPSQRVSLNDNRIATAQALREQLLNDIQHSIVDIDRELTSLDRRPSVPRYLPPRFSPIVELDAHDDNLFRQIKRTNKPVSVPMKKTVPIITSPKSKSIQQTSAHSSITKENSNDNSQSWPNKPKRIYQVIPSLPSDSRKTSRQSSVGAQRERIKTSEIYSNQSTPKLVDKSISSSKFQLHGQYHYGPEVEETEILPNDPESTDHKSTFDEMEGTNQYEPLNTDQFLRDLSPPPQSRAAINVPEFSGNSQLESHESAEDLIHENQIGSNNARALTANSLHDLTPTNDSMIQDTKLLIQTTPEDRAESELKAEHLSIPRESPKDNEIDLENENENNLILSKPDENENNLILSKPNQNSRPSTKASRRTPIAANDDLIEKSTLLQVPTIDSTVDINSLSPPPSSPPAAAAVNNIGGIGAYFFSDYGNDGEGEEDLMPIDQSNFVVPSGADIIPDDTISNSLLGQSQASLLTLHSAHVPQQKPPRPPLQQQQQQQHTRQLTSVMSLTSINNNEHRKVEENEEIESKETDAMKKGTTNAISVLPPSSPSPKKNLLTSAIDNMQTQFSRNNSRSNDDHHHHRQSSTTISNSDAVYSNIKEHEKRLNISRIHRRSSVSVKSQMQSRIQSATSQKDEKQFKNKFEETPSLSTRSNTPFKNIDNENIETSERIDSANQRLKSPSKTISRGASMISNPRKHAEAITPIDSATKSALSHIDRESSVGSRESSRPSSIAPSEQSRLSQRRSGSLYRSVINDELGQLVSSNDLNQYTKPTNNNEPNTFSVQSEHFLHHEQHTTYDMNQRMPSNFSEGHPGEPRQSLTGSPLPVALDSPEHDNNPPKSSRTGTPKNQSSVCSMEMPSNPNVILTTTDDPDPNDSSIMNSTIHFQMLSSQPPNTDRSFDERNDPSPLANIVPVQTFPSRIPSVELPSELLTPEEQLNKSSSNLRRSPTPKVELQPNSTLPPGSPENDPLLRASTLHRTLSPPKIEREETLSHQTPTLSYPAPLEDLMRPTPSPLLSANEHQQNQNENVDNTHLSSVSTPINENHHAQQYSPNKLENNNIHSQLSSPRRSVLSDTNHTSVEGDDTYRQQLDTPPMSPKNLSVISHNHDSYMNNKQLEIQKPPSPISSPINQLFISENQRYPSSERSISPIQVRYQQHGDDHLQRNDIQLSSASIRLTKNPTPHSSASNTRPTSTDDDYPAMTPSQQHSKLSLRLRKQKSKRKKSLGDQQPAPPQIDTSDISQMNNDENLDENKPKQRQRRRVSFSSSIAHFHVEEQQLLTNWRERVAAILASKHRQNEKYSHVQSRVNSFANFEYQPKKIKVVPVKKSRPKVVEPTTVKENKFAKRKKFKVKRPKPQPVTSPEDQTDDDQQPVQQLKEPAPQLFGRLWCLPDGSPTVFHESLEWNVASKLRSYSYENLNYEPHRSEFKIFNKKPKWQSESKLADLMKEQPRFLRPQTLVPNNMLPMIPDRGKPYSYQQRSNLEDGMERKIFDIQTNIQQSGTRFPNNFPENMSYRSHGSRLSDVPIFNEKLAWLKQSKLKDTTWKNINYQPKKSKVQIFNKTVRWNGESKVRTRSPSSVYPAGGSMSNVQIFDEKLNWDAQAKVHCWSEIDLRQLTKKKAIFAQYHDPKWNDIVTPRVDANNHNYSKFSNHVEIFSDRPTWTRNSELKDYVWENFDYKSHPRTGQSNNQRRTQESDQENEKMAFDLRISNEFESQFRRLNSPPNKPKWNAVSKTRSLNSVYNPKMGNSTMIRRSWDQDLRRKRVHRLPPLKRKRKHDEMPRLAIDGLPSTMPPNTHLSIDYNYEHGSVMQGRATSNGYGTMSSRRSSKALVPINPHRNFPDLELPAETPRSQRPVQQEWYDEMNKSRLTHRTDMGRITNHSFRNSIDSLHQANTPRELATFRSSTRNSQNSAISGTLLDSSIRTNRATEFRLAKDMEEHHHHSHTPSQSMPIEIRGFQLEGTQLSVDNATIRPLSNVSYGTSERVKSRRVYPWSSLHPHGTSSRNSSLVPIAEFRRPSLDTTITEAQQLIHEE
ncbi:unnamed protein product [Rotaria magnacalcarata]|uniref:Uncharacterized protein n=1 Tax=Rotaria magnacalcarata TaxID=392030 RepID=A0A816PNZ1_9BILA|nr:unnamed protein product [Rotaria magnacalcarata]